MIDPVRFWKSVIHALRGVSVVFRSEQSFRLQVYLGVFVLVFAGLFQVNTFEWIMLVLLIGSVLILELINSILERIVDSFKPRIHPIVRDIKDMMAGAVLIASLISAAVGVVIFYPHLLLLVRALG